MRYFFRSYHVPSRRGHTVNPIKLETGLRPNSAGIPYTLLLRVEAMGFPTFWLLLYLPLVSREWKNGSNSSYNCTPFLHALLTKGKHMHQLLRSLAGKNNAPILAGLYYATHLSPKQTGFDNTVESG